jgi:hypothetical protein
MAERDSKVIVEGKQERFWKETVGDYKKGKDKI